MFLSGSPAEDNGHDISGVQNQLCRNTAEKLFSITIKIETEYINRSSIKNPQERFTEGYGICKQKPDQTKIFFIRGILMVIITMALKFLMAL
jgi:hypothetical protein